LRTGRFGPYVQRGDGKEAKRASLPKGWKADTMDHEKALALLSLPRDIGQHPETGKMISSSIGRYGPFLLHDGSYANLESVEDVFSVGLNRAVAVLADKKANPGAARRGGTPAALKDLGAHPDGGSVTVRDGKYGPYVNWGKINATLPKAKDPQAVTLEEAIAWLVEKAGKAPSAKGKGKAAPKAKPAPKAKSAASADTKAKAPVKKPAAKKPAAKSAAKPKAATKAKTDSKAGKAKPASKAEKE
jgi:DNA topoisomerase I